MASILDLRRRIRSVKNTRQITKAMKMISAAKLRRAQERALASRPYARMMAAVIQSLMRRMDAYDPNTGEVRHPMLVAREEKNVLMVVVSGDKGFAGAFNNNITKATFKFLDARGDLNVDLEPIGKKARDTFRRRYPEAKIAEEPANEWFDRMAANNPEMTNTMASPAEATEEETMRKRLDRNAPIEVTGDHPGLLEQLHFPAVSEIGADVVQRYIDGEIDAAYVVYNEFKSVISQRVVMQRILPVVDPDELDAETRPPSDAVERTREERTKAGKAALSAGVSTEEPDTSELDEEAKKFGTADVDYIYEQSPAEMLASLLPRYVSTELYHAMIESVAAEHAARMTAMDAATTNASKMIDSLTLTMNRVRQAAITNEIIEIVSGAAAI
jgi:F-type H+-transporting ATPase subunit gamma